MSEAPSTADRVAAIAEMPHLKKATADIIGEAQKSVEAPTKEQEEEKKAEADPRTKPKYTFDFSHTDHRGKVWKGKFTNTRLTIRDQRAIGNAQAMLSGNLPYEALDPLTREINLMLAHMGVSLVPDDSVQWAQNFDDLDSIPLLQALYKEVIAHERIFHGLRETEAGS